jgi:hypothetical protein
MGGISLKGYIFYLDFEVHLRGSGMQAVLKNSSFLSCIEGSFATEAREKLLFLTRARNGPYPILKRHVKSLWC